MMTSQQMILASIISNVIALLLLLVSWKKKNMARIFFAILFIGAAITNWKTAREAPESYLEFGKYAVPLYREIIYGAFAAHIAGYISLIALAQLFIGIGLLAKGLVVKLCCIAGIIFFTGIAGLGFGAAFPFSVTASLALLFLYRHPFERDIFQNKSWV